MGDIDDLLAAMAWDSCSVRPIIRKCGNLTNIKCSLCTRPVCSAHLVGSECIHCNALL